MEAGQISTLPPSQQPAIKQQFPSRQSATMFNGATGQKPHFISHVSTVTLIIPRLSVPQFLQSKKEKESFNRSGYASTA
jgi:hypothetical protein